MNGGMYQFSPLAVRSAPHQTDADHRSAPLERWG